MTDSPRVARLDADTLVERIADITGVRFVVEGPCPGGEVGAAYVRWPDGRRSVLSEGHSRTGPLLDRARAAGVPTAKLELSAHIDGRRVIVQQCLPGAVPTPATTSASLVEQMVRVNARLRGLLADRPLVAPVELHLTTDGPGFCLHKPLIGYDRRTARLLDWVHEVGAATPAITGDDLVHFDYHPFNVLVDRGRITGVIDWDGADRFDGRFDLVTLQFHLRRWNPAATGPVDEALAGIPADRYRAFWAHMSLRQIDWSIRHHDHATVDAWLDIAEPGTTI
ncbi:phosphotransferase [Actinoplanes sp. NPDC051633]|uniref:phosphotransferase n=1 Tax=Actinoplanes sp. NPDC051633 TaxID=3155670 RepID=UPI00341B29D8